MLLLIRLISWLIKGRIKVVNILIIIINNLIRVIIGKRYIRFNGLNSQRMLIIIITRRLKSLKICCCKMIITRGLINPVRLQLLQVILANSHKINFLLPLIIAYHQNTHQRQNIPHRNKNLNLWANRIILLKKDQQQKQQQQQEITKSNKTVGGIL